MNIACKEQGEVIEMGPFQIDNNRRVVIYENKVIPFHPKMKGENILVNDRCIVIDNYKLTEDGKWIRKGEGILRKKR